MADDRGRPSLHDAAYRRQRPVVLAQEPWCPGHPLGIHDCPRCGARFDHPCRHRERVRTTSVDHRKPLVQGGGHERANLRGLCGSCNSRKGRAEASSRRRVAPSSGAGAARSWRQV